MNITWNEILTRLSSPRALKQRVFVPVLILLSIGSIVLEIDSRANASLVSLFAVLVSLAIAWLFALLLERLVNLTFRSPGVARFLAVVVVYFATEVIRTLLVEWQNSNMGIGDELNIPFRIIAGGFTGLAFFGVAGFLVDESDDYREALGIRLASTLKLQHALTLTAEDVEVRRIHSMEAIRRAITTAVRNVLRGGDVTARDVASDLIRVSEDVVRPLSHRLVAAESLPEFESEVASVTGRTKIRFHTILNYATYVQPFRPEVLSLLMAMLTIGPVLFIVSTGNQLAALSALVWVYLFVALLRLLVQPGLERIALGWRIVILCFCFSGVGLSSFAIFLGVVGSFATSFAASLVYLVVIAQLVMWSLAIVSGLRRARIDLIQEVEDLNARLKWQRARLAMHQWGFRNVVAVALHNEVQGTLLASAMKLKLLREAGKDDAEAIEEVRLTVLNTANFVSVPASVPPLDVVVHELNQQWQSILTLNVTSTTADTLAVARLNSDDLARRVLADLLTEYMTNAVKHGQASVSELSLTLISDGVVRLDLVNNGRPIRFESVDGLGARMVEAVSVGRGFTNFDGGVRAWADLPIV